MMRVLFWGLILWAGPVAAQRGSVGSVAAPRDRWKLSGDGGIYWEVGAADVHTDHIEMAGKGIAAIVTYGMGYSGRLELWQQLVFPGLRKIPNDTRGSYTLKLSDHVADSILVDNQPIVETPVSFYIRGLLRSVSRTQTPLMIQRTIFPSVDKRAYLESYILTNSGPVKLRVHVPVITDDSVTDGKNQVEGPFVVSRRTYDG